MRLLFIPRRAGWHLSLFVLVSVLLHLPCLAQTSLTLSSNSFRDGDSLVTRMINDTQPGLSGCDAVWDFSDSIRGSFRGMGVWCDRTYMRVWGDGVTRADSEGTLILSSGDTLRHVLRVHSMRRTWQAGYDSIRTWGSLHNMVRQKTRAALVPENTRFLSVFSLFSL